MLKIIRTDSSHGGFNALIKQLDVELAQIDGKEHSFYAQYNKTDHIKHVIVAFDEEIPVACGAIKTFDNETMEVKRMYTSTQYRNKGIASLILAELEKWSAEMNYRFCILETGLRQPDAIQLYRKNGYLTIPNYGQYAGIENSRCFRKTIVQQ